ncbi:YihY/virulence factor BrkB family protein [Bacillus massilinigeriensis]|uniref:YihY/virulence factor BrkB family protein n=1 Tax=Bacillus mediterraneensis TaxID=1805474 RepID=UPI0008F8AB7D|nr:YihY/virulence factor BrkB family protein [Bacillus mediterraneensis]
MKKRWILYGKSIVTELKNDRATGLAAQQAYYYMLALFPMLILLVSIVPYLNIEPTKAIRFVNNVLPPETAGFLKKNIIKIISERNGGLVTFGVIGTLWSASNGMNAFIKAMNTAYDVEETRSFIKTRILSIGLTLGMILAFIIALVLPVFGNVLLNLVQQIIPMPDETAILIKVLRWIVALVVITAVLTVLYYFAPNKKYSLMHAIPGAIFATIAWQLTSLGFSFYVSNFSNYSATYGSLGAVIVLMLWLFLTGLALLLGGEINAIYHSEKLGGEQRYERKRLLSS